MKFQARMIRRQGGSILRALDEVSKPGLQALRRAQPAAPRQTEKDVREQARRTAVQGARPSPRARQRAHVAGGARGVTRGVGRQCGGRWG